MRAAVSRIWPWQRRRWFRITLDLISWGRWERTNAVKSSNRCRFELRSTNTTSSMNSSIDHPSPQKFPFQPYHPSPDSLSISSPTSFAAWLRPLHYSHNSDRESRPHTSIFTFPSVVMQSVQSVQSIEGSGVPGTVDENGEGRQQKPKTLPCKYCSKRFR